MLTRGADLPVRITQFVVALAQLATPAIAFPGGFDAATGASLQPAADPNPASPAGFAFAIWGPIFLGAVIAAMLQLGGRRAADPGFAAARPLCIAGYALSIAWMFAASRLPWATVPIIVAMLVTLGGALVAMADRRRQRDTVADALIVTPLALYVGWLTAATFVNAADVLPRYAPGAAIGGTMLGIAVLLGASLTALWFTRRLRGLLGYAAAVVWALLGIVAANLAPTPNWPIVATAVAAALLVGFATVRARSRQGADR